MTESVWLESQRRVSTHQNNTTPANPASTTTSTPTATSPQRTTTNPNRVVAWLIPY